MTNTDSRSDDLVSDQARLMFQCIGFAAVCQAIDLFGTVANIINIICFAKMGFKNPDNISLLGLAISDLGSLVTLIWLNISLTPAFQQADLPFDAFELQYVTAGWPHVVFARVSGWITALITLERCLCISVPLKVKTIVTSRRVTLIIVSMFVVLIASVIPVYFVNKVASKFFSDRNKTYMGLIFTEDRESVDKISLIINVIFHFTSFFIILICTLILVIKLQRKTQWRKRAAANSNSSTIVSRDQNLAKMIAMISSFFIICFTPVCISMMAMFLEPEFAITGKYKNIFILIFGIGFILESTNSSVNIFIYYRMSSKYRAVFRQLFCKPLHDQVANAAIVLANRSC